MPKLDSKTAGAVDSTEANHGGDFEPLEPGKYLARLGGVEARDNANTYGLLMWSAEFDEIFSLDGAKQPGRQWLQLTLPGNPKPPANYPNGQEKWDKYQNLLRGRLAAFFEAFGYSADSDTDEMVGEWALISLSIRTIQKGPKQGQLANQVDDISPVPDDAVLPEITEDDTSF